MDDSGFFGDVLRRMSSELADEAPRGPIRREVVDLAGQWEQFAGWLQAATVACREHDHGVRAPGGFHRGARQRACASVRGDGRGAAGRDGHGAGGSALDARPVLLRPTPWN